MALFCATDGPKALKEKLLHYKKDKKKRVKIEVQHVSGPRPAYTYVVGYKWVSITI